MEPIKLELMAAEGTAEVIVRQGTAPAIFVYSGYEYAVRDRESFVAAVTAMGTPGQTVLAYNDSRRQVVANIDRTETSRKQDRIILDLNPSEKLKRWIDILERPMDHRTFIRFLERENDGPLDYLIASVKQLKFVTQIHGDYTYDDNNNYNFSYKIGDADGIARLPSTFSITFSPALENGIATKVIDFELELKKPSNERERPSISIAAPRLPDELKEAFVEEMADIRKALPGFLILNGSLGDR